MTSAHQLLLLTDHLKLSLLERERARSLNIDATKQDGQITSSLESLRTGLEQLETQDEEPRELESLRQQYNELYAQFHGSAPAASLRSPNEPALRADFAAAQEPRRVRFRDDPEDENRTALFEERYQDEPTIDQSELSNQQIHEYHRQVIQDQDDQLDVLGQSLGRQRMIGIQMGSEIEEQNEMLDDVERGMDRHTNLLDRAGRRLGDVARKGKANWSWLTIAILICILVLLLVLLK